MSWKERIKEYAILTFGTLLVAAGIYFFKYPNHFTTGGVSGLSILLGAAFPKITPGTYVIIINVAFLILGFLILNRDFGIKTVYCSLLMSGAVRLFEIVFPMTDPLTSQKFLELVYSIMFPAVGSAILFNYGGSTGGTDIIAMILKKFVSIDIGKALMCTDFLIAASSTLFFGIETGLFSLLGLAMKAVMVDSVIENINLKKSLIIITEKPKDVCHFILNEMHRGATVWKAKGAFTDQDKYVVMIALNRAQAIRVQRFVKTVDPQSFTVISNTSGIIGKGFREVS